MHGEDLPPDRMPLVEAVFELKWKIPPSPTPELPASDPAYKLLVGSLFDKVKKDYPYHEQLPTATVPDEFVPHMVQHRFRRSEGGYPLIQVGPGIFAANEASGYSWKAYLPRILQVVETLRQTYAAKLEAEALVLRYINAVPFDFRAQDVLVFLRENLKVHVDYPPQLFTEVPVESRPQGALLQTNHSLRDPAGEVIVKFATGEYEGRAHLIWETQVHSTGAAAPSLDGLEGWLNSAHDVARAWFFTFISGRLEKEFRT